MTRIIQLFLVCTIGALVAAGMYTSSRISDTHAALDKVRRYSISHATEHALHEFSRLQNALLLLKHDPGEDELHDVRLRFEILYSRVGGFEGADFLRFAELEPKRQAAFAAFRWAMLALDPVLTGPQFPDVAQALSILSPLEPQLTYLTAEANSYGAELLSQDRNALEQLHVRFSMLSFGLMVCGVFLVGMLAWHNKLLTRAHRKLSSNAWEMQRAAADLEAAKAEAEAANLELRNQNGMFNAALNNMSQGLCMFAGDDLLPIIVNRQFERMFRLAEAEGNEDAASLHGSIGLIPPDLAAAMREVFRTRRGASFEKHCVDGRIIAVTQRPMPTEGWVATFEDVTAQRRAQARIEHMASHDVLTNLPNRYAFRKRLHAALERSRATGGMVAIMCLDLDHFKEVNDTLGHPVGDALLCAAAERLRACLRETDMVSRVGGDEFAVLLPSVEEARDAECLARRIVQEMGKPFQLERETVYATISLGIALAPVHGDDADKLLKNADMALYAAKADGRRTFRVFEPMMDERLAHRHAIERDLRAALGTSQLSLHYQPVVNLRTMKITGLEALVRWDHPQRGSVSPSDFIPVAENTGLISDLGRFVLDRACQDAAAWASDLKIAVNLSAAQFTQSDIAADVSHAIAKAGLQPHRLVVEITESLLLNEDKRTSEKLSQLKRLGVQIAMDDFGTGYSSLSYLRKYPFDRIKIDRSFLQTASDGPQGAAILRTIVELGETLGMTTIAEGIETEADLELLLSTDCVEGQGYLFSPAVPRDQIPALLAAHGRNFSQVA
jgi:diguanylate cyclase (GGDEF)-like protein